MFTITRRVGCSQTDEKGKLSIKAAVDMMQDCSLITATYHVDGKLAGKIGVIGPTRMRYGEITSVVEFLTENISNAFKLPGGGKDE